jgi:hypothetical protein
MGRWKAWALAGLLAVLLSALLASGTPAEDNELLVNGGFENDLDGEWRTTSQDNVIERVCGPDGVVHAGSCAGRMTCHGPQKCEVSQTLREVGYGQYYELEGYIARSQEGLTMLVLVDWYETSDGTGPRLVWPGQSALCTEAGDAPYDCLISAVQSAPPEARSAKIKVIAIDALEGVIVYLDDFSFTGPPAPAPSPSPTQTPSPTAGPSPSPTVRPSPSPEPTAPSTPSPMASPSPTAVPTATEAPSTATPSPSTPTPTAGLVNGGFEEAEDDGKPISWRKYGGELSRSSAAAWEGQFAAAFTSRTASTKWVFQTVAAEGGAAYVLSGYALKNDANVQVAYLRLSWYASPDGSGKAIANVDSTTRLTDDSPRFRFLTSGPVVAPVEAASAKVRLMLDPRSEAEGMVYFDAISFGETAMPSQPAETPQPSPASASTETPAASAVLPASAPEQPAPSSSPDSPRRSPTALAATAADPEATVSGADGASPSETDSEGRPARTPVVLYRERRAAQSTQGGEGVAAGDDESDGLSPIVLVLAAAPPAAAAAAMAFFGWRRWRERARPP